MTARASLQLKHAVGAMMSCYACDLGLAPCARTIRSTARGKEILRRHQVTGVTTHHGADGKRFVPMMVSCTSVSKILMKQARQSLCLFLGRIMTRVAIGASGGKDSTVLAAVLKTLNERYDYGLDLC
jgi:hypothetical protein